MSAELQFVEIPGYADALRREDALRRQAWANPGHEVCGLQLRALTLRDMEVLAELRNGFFCPWRFDEEAEYLGHCAQLVWWLSAAPKPRPSGDSFVRRIYVERARQRLTRHLLRDLKGLSEGVRALLRETFFDAPRGGGSGPSGAAIAANPAYVVDALAAAGHAWPLERVLDTPLVQLWQVLRVAQKRVTGMAPPNESDRLAVEHLARLNAEAKGN